MKKYIVTGGSGYIGYPIVKKIVDSKKDVTVFDVKDTKIKGAKFIKCDLTNKEDVINAFKNLTTKDEYIFIHLAALFVKDASKRGEYKDEDYTKLNTLATKNLVDAIIENKGKVNVTSFVFSSTSLVNFEESVKTDPYTRTKLESEKEVERLKGIVKNIQIIRLSRVIGIGKPKEVPIDIVSDYMRYILAPEPFDLRGPTILRDYVHISDVRNMMIYMADQRGPFSAKNLFTTKPITMKQIADIIVESMKDAGMIDGKEIKEGTKTDPLTQWNAELPTNLLNYDTSEKVIRQVIKEYMPFFKRGP